MSESPDLPGDLLALAREDLVAAEALDKDERISDSPVGFHAQQAVEKALKAVIASRESEFPFTHDLGLLMQLCEDAGLELPAELTEADRLTPYAAAIRYGLGDPKAVEAERAIRWAAQAIDWADAEIHPGEDVSGQ
ncbi:MAG TPA: HEPN domain-containing protein [Solirubrobacterales bacterium]|jgi:HEPN domain-containing protein|nr:HEPN domain-containing protein [Solirubrobacterales bacterium]